MPYPSRYGTLVVLFLTYPTVMPIKPAAFKALRQTKKRTARNTKIRSDLEALVRRVRKTAGSDAAKAADWFRQTVKAIDRAVQRGVLKKNTAARTKSRLAKLIKSAAKR